VQLCPPVEVIRTDAAVTAPVEPVVPFAVTQSPTARLLAAAGCVSLYAVDELRAIVRLLLVVEAPDAGAPVAEVP
jgi:hypothetical protein